MARFVKAASRVVMIILYGCFIRNVKLECLRSAEREIQHQQVKSSVKDEYRANWSSWGHAKSVSPTFYLSPTLHTGLLGVDFMNVTPLNTGTYSTSKSAEY